MMDSRPPPVRVGTVQRSRAALSAVRRAATSLPGKLLGLTVGFVLLAEILIFLPSAAAFRTEWLQDRAQSAHLAAIAAENAAGAMPSEDMVMELLDGADVVAVGRVYGGVNELVLGGDVQGELVRADLTDTSLFESIRAACATLLAPRGRFINIWAMPETRPDERISVIVREAPLREALIAFSLRIAGLSIFISLVTGSLIYVSLLYLLVRPMRRLARAMTAFQEDPADPARSYVASARSDEIGDSERALAAMQADVQMAFRQREHLAALGGAVAKINHDLRNVLSSAQLISDRLAANSDVRVAAMGARLVRAIDRGVRLCTETLEYGRSREREAEPVEVCLRDAADDAAGDAFAALGPVDWRNTIAADIRVSADPDHLHRIFLNLFRNGLQAMDARPDACLCVSAREEDGRVVTEIHDTGPGIPARVRETLFQPVSVTGSSGGTGLGLSIARELARALGGDVSLARSNDSGSVFEVALRRGASG
ncbi:ATP-binding protein [Marinicauda pacifica]|uniref:ATP-binding protein n=1 Tax=Marinicauda pacifica TaxID=1133559 RepID=UPI0035C7C40A